MYVGYGALELHLPYARDLKSKRRIVRGLVERLHARLRISAAETAHHDLHQRAAIGVAVVSRSLAELESLLAEIGRIADGEPEAVLLDWQPEIVHEEP
jgi:uncharacterized protein YlxP (DUF503 family)